MESATLKTALQSNNSQKHTQISRTKSKKEDKKIGEKMKLPKAHLGALASGWSVCAECAHARPPTVTETRFYGPAAPSAAARGPKYRDGLYTL